MPATSFRVGTRCNGDVGLRGAPMTLLTDKERADALAKACENLYVHNVALRALLQSAKVAGWHRMLDRILDSDLASQTRAAFQQGYSQALSEMEQQKLKLFLET